MAGTVPEILAALKVEVDTLDPRINILETCCFPKGCLIDADDQPYLATVKIPKLRANGLRVAEWTRGALLLEEPFFSRVKLIVCAGCNIVECPHHPGEFDLRNMTSGRSDKRQATGQQALDQLLPKSWQAELAVEGIKCSAWQRVSRKSASLEFTFERGSKHVYISACPAAHRPSTSLSPEPVFLRWDSSSVMSQILEAITAAIEFVRA